MLDHDTGPDIDNLKMKTINPDYTILDKYTNSGGSWWRWFRRLTKIPADSYNTILKNCKKHNIPNHVDNFCAIAMFLDEGIRPKLSFYPVNAKEDVLENNKLVTDLKNAKEYLGISDLDPVHRVAKIYESHLPISITIEDARNPKLILKSNEFLETIHHRFKTHVEELLSREDVAPTLYRYSKYQKPTDALTQVANLSKVIFEFINKETEFDGRTKDKIEFIVMLYELVGFDFEKQALTSTPDKYLSDKIHSKSGAKLFHL